jgi:hypothetical protein
MSRLDDISKQYAALIEREDATRRKLAETRGKLENAREVDVSAAAHAALAGTKAPKRTELTLRHAEENLGVELDGIDEAVFSLQMEARRAVGEGRDFPIWIPPNALTRAEVIAEMRATKVREDGESDDEFEARLVRQIPRHGDVESIVAEAHRQRELSLDRRLPRLTERPADLIAWVESAYDAEDEAVQIAYEFRARKQRGKDATAAVQRAKAEHRRRGLPAESFRIQSYPDIVLPEHLAEFKQPITRSPFEKARDVQPPSMEEAQNEPVAEPQPVESEAEFRRREIAGIPPAAAPDVKPINPDADLPPQERAAARAARIAGEEAA